MALSTSATTALELSTYITSLVLGAESSIATAGSGETKLQIVLSGIQSAATAGYMAAPNNTVAEYTALIAATVAIFNASGIFTHSTPAAPPA